MSAQMIAQSSGSSEVAPETLPGPCWRSADQLARLETCGTTNRIARHLSLAAALLACPATSNAEVVWSGIVNLNIPSNFNGL